MPFALQNFGFWDKGKREGETCKSEIVCKTGEVADFAYIYRNCSDFRIQTSFQILKFEGLLRKIYRAHENILE